MGINSGGGAIILHFCYKKVQKCQKSFKPVMSTSFWQRPFFQHNFKRQCMQIWEMVEDILQVMKFIPRRLRSVWKSWFGDFPIERHFVGKKIPTTDHIVVQSFGLLLEVYVMLKRCRKVSKTLYKQKRVVKSKWKRCSLSWDEKFILTGR